eukprot:1861892-Rhodomonas_salina.3
MMLRVCYAMSGTDLGHAATRNMAMDDCRVEANNCGTGLTRLCNDHAISGTDVAMCYKCPVLP